MRESNALKTVQRNLRALPLVAQGLAVELGVHVVFGVDAPFHGCVDLRTNTISLGGIPVPRDEQDVAGAERMLDYLYGLIHHEVGHVRHTQPNVWDKAKKIDALTHGLVNAIEDPRQERKHIADYPGAEGRLNNLVARCIEDGIFAPLSATDTPGKMVQIYTMYYLRRLLRGQDEVEQLLAASRPVVVAALGEAFVTRLETLCLIEAPDMRKTADAAALALAILQALKEEAEKPPQPAPNATQQGSAGTGGSGGSGTQPGASQGQDSGGDAAAQGKGKRKGKGQGKGKGKQGEAPATPGASPANPAPSSDPSGAGQSNTPSSSGTGGSGASPHQQQALRDAVQDQTVHAQDLGELVKPVLDKVQQQLQGSCGERLTTTSVPQGDLTKQRNALRMGNGSVDLESTMCESGRLRQKLQVEIQGLRMRKTQETKRGTRLNHRALHRLAIGDNRVFLKVQPQKALDTAVFILVDVSGSMNGVKMKMAAEALYTTAVAMNSLTGVKTAAVTFPGNATVIDFHERAVLNSERFRLDSYGGTPLYEGLLLAYRELRRRPESRKLLMVITDGQPSDVESCRETAQQLQRWGIDVMGLGIMEPGVQDLFPAHRVIQSIDELSFAMLEMLRHELRRQLAA